ncbi:hypothetical protein C8Q76DRAFT_800274 [Earliella scabrosa]|nr:hypothetical protein C8Q76DRAFT_800274 [Earliella scabrosa]
MEAFGCYLIHAIIEAYASSSEGFCVAVLWDTQRYRDPVASKTTRPDFTLQYNYNNVSIGEVKPFTTLPKDVPVFELTAWRDYAQSRTLDAFRQVCEQARTFFATNMQCDTYYHWITVGWYFTVLRFTRPTHEDLEAALEEEEALLKGQPQDREYILTVDRMKEALAKQAADLLRPTILYFVEPMVQTMGSKKTRSEKPVVVRPQLWKALCQSCFPHMQEAETKLQASWMKITANGEGDADPAWVEKGRECFRMKRDAILFEFRDPLEDFLKEDKEAKNLQNLIDKQDKSVHISLSRAVRESLGPRFIPMRAAKAKAMGAS